MIRSLYGKISSHSDQRVVLTVHDVGYLVYTNAIRHNFVLDEFYLFHTHLAVRETALDLYGFVEEKELRFFELLLTIPKIGPKSALQILCLADPDLLATAILLQDSEQLHKTAGIGKKTAANIVTHLAGKIEADFTPEVNKISPTKELKTAQIDAIEALVTLGYEQKEASNLVLKLSDDLDAKSLIQAVLKQSPM